MARARKQGALGFAHIEGAANGGGEGIGLEGDVAIILKQCRPEPGLPCQALK